MKLAASVAVSCLLNCAPAFAQTPAEQPPPPVPSATAMASAAASASMSAPPADNNNRVLYPANGTQFAPATVRATGEPAGNLPGLAVSFLLLLALCAGGIYLLRRQGGFTPVGKGQRKLVVSESRSLGNRQFLVVVEFESERVLLGVTPGKIDYLCPLPFKEQVS